jgi:HAD superfamily hydrolase (TIGR01509 family)
MNSIKAILFDFDGTLINAKEWHFDALNIALVKNGFNKIPHNEHLLTFDGLSTNQKLDLLSIKNKETRQKINEEKQRQTIKILKKETVPNNDIVLLLKKLDEAGYTIGCCSNAIRNTVETGLSYLGIKHYFKLILSNEDVSKQKPDPEIYKKACEKLGIEPKECLVVEDNQKGIEAGLTAGCFVHKVKGPEDLSGIVDKLTAIEPTINLVIPMAGLGSRFRNAGYKNPKPFIEVDSVPMIELVINNLCEKSLLGKDNVHVILIAQNEHLTNYASVFADLTTKYFLSVVCANSLTRGAAETVLLSESLINSDLPLIIANSDQYIKNFNLGHFVKKAQRQCAQGSIVCFEDLTKNPKWSFVKTSETDEDRIVETVEKQPISTWATVGIYYFDKGRDFVKNAKMMISSGKTTNGEFYVCPVYNFMIKDQGSYVSKYDIETSDMFGLGTPEDLERFLNEKPTIQ